MKNTKKAGKMISTAFGIMLLSSIVAITFQPRSIKKAALFSKCMIAFNIIGLSCGLYGGHLLTKDEE
jgi:hypothetical protein